MWKNGYREKGEHGCSHGNTYHVASITSALMFHVIENVI